MDDTQTESGRETAAPGRAAPAPIVRLSAEDISSIASTVAEILRRQGQREDRETTSGAGGTGGPSTAASTDTPATQSKAGKGVFESGDNCVMWWQPGQKAWLATRPPTGKGVGQGLFRIYGLRNLVRLPSAHQNGMGLEAPPEWDRHVA